ncbi:hypothetical protein M2317_000793 [Microbacterium sp. ZKA21]|uniref:DUF2207 family protein n=1 Tax=Microbacterium sp. ZKA21 TaxID=3381694 RepID=UPI003D20D940
MLVALILGLIPALLLLGGALWARAVAHATPASPGARFAPSDGADVVSDGLLLRADRRTVAAALVDMAVRRKVRLLAPDDADKRTPVGVEVVDGAQFTPGEIAVLEALFGPDHTPGRVRRFSKDRRALSGRVRTLLANAEQRLIDAGLVGRGRRTWPVVVLWVFAWAGIASTLFFALGTFMNDDVVGAVLLLVSTGVVIAAMCLIPRPWRRFAPAADPLRTHLAGVREYIALAEREPLRFGQSVDGALLRADVSAEASDARLQRFLLNERLLPYAVLFGEERSWSRMLKLDGQDLAHVEGMDDVLDAVEGVLVVLELVGGALNLITAVGDLADATGGAIEGIGSVLDALS